MAKFAPTVDRITERTFLVIARDGEGSAAIRDSHLDGHLEFIEKNCDRYLTCGPMNDPGEPELVGSFFLLVADDERNAREFLAGDPYMASGMYASVSVHEVTAAGGRWMGGVIWESADAIRARAS
jgi:uncharacterized protein YciI